MAETFGPFDGPSTVWTQAQWFDFAQAWAPSGVIGTPASSTTAGELALAVNGLNLTLGTGRAWVRGAGYENDAGKAFAVTANTNASLSRRDRIVVRRDLAAKTVTAVRLTGTPAATPQAPALTQNDAGQWDLPLHSFLVPPNSGTTLTGLIDERTWADPDGNGRPASACRFTASQPAGSVPPVTPWGCGPITLTAQRGGTFAASTDFITVPVAGMYHIVWSVVFDTIFAPRSFMQVTIGGSAPYRQPMGGPSETTATLSTLASIGAGQTVTFQTYSNQATGNAGNSSHGFLVRIGDQL